MIEIYFVFLILIEIGFIIPNSTVNELFIPFWIEVVNLNEDEIPFVIFIVIRHRFVIPLLNEFIIPDSLVRSPSATS